MKPLQIRLAASGCMEIEIPSVLAEGRSHSIEIPMTLAGLSALKTVLVQRQRAESSQPPTIGSRGSPTASMIQKHLADKDRQDRDAAKRVAQDLIGASALDEIELEL